MSYYDSDAAWSAPARQPSWEQQQLPSSRSGAANAPPLSPHTEANAFASQFDEVDRATDNLMKSGKWYPGQIPPMGSMPTRRESLPPVGRGYDYGGSGGGDPRMGGGGSGSGGGGGSGGALPSSRNQSMSEYDNGVRPGSAGLQGYYHGQRYPAGRQSEAEQMLQAKRRMAAQRERELRNYHQEQQYNRTVSGGKSDRSMSPNTMSEEDRRELIARQHRALYGDSSSIYGPDGSPARTLTQDARLPPSAGGPRGASPLAYDPYAQPGADAAVQMPPRDRDTTTASPVSSAPPAQQQQQPPAPSSAPAAVAAARTSNSSPAASPPLGVSLKGGVAPIGTRPLQQQQQSQSQQPSPTSASSSSAAAAVAAALSKRSTTPLTPSALSHGVSVDAAAANNKDKRSTSATSNSAPALSSSAGPSPAVAGTEKSSSATAAATAAGGSSTGIGGWGSNSGVWGSGGKSALAVQPSVWG